MGNILAANWQRAGSGLAAPWQQMAAAMAALGSRLAADWQPIGSGPPAAGGTVFTMRKNGIRKADISAFCNFYRNDSRGARVSTQPLP
jgi:hypothetical protein